jgi:hypothetical protein
LGVRSRCRTQTFSIGGFLNSTPQEYNRFDRGEKGPSHLRPLHIKPES